MMGKKIQKTSNSGCLKFGVTKKVCIKSGQVSLLKSRNALMVSSWEPEE